MDQAEKGKRIEATFNHHAVGGFLPCAFSNLHLLNSDRHYRILSFL